MKFKFKMQQFQTEAPEMKATTERQHWSKLDLAL
jgi:hypothetical protein